MAFDHQYIEKFRIVERYVRRALSLEERSLFEAHLPDCPECLDRLALAEMFRSKAQEPVPTPPPVCEPQPAGLGLLRQFLTLPAADRHRWLAVAALLIIGSPLAFIIGTYVGLQRGGVPKSLYYYQPVVTAGIDTYGVAVLNAAGKVVTATTGLKVKDGQQIAIPIADPAIAPGDYTVQIRARLLDGRTLTLQSLHIRNTR